MIVCIEVFPGRAFFSASDDPSGSPVTRAGRFDSELTIIPALLLWQKSFIVTKNGAILAIWKRATLLDQLQRVPGFPRQFADQHHIAVRRGARHPACRKYEREHEKQRTKEGFSRKAMLHGERGLVRVP